MTALSKRIQTIIIHSNGNDKGSSNHLDLVQFLKYREQAAEAGKTVVGFYAIQTITCNNTQHY